MSQLKQLADWVEDNAWGLYLAMYLLVPSTMLLLLGLYEIPSIISVDSKLLAETFIVAFLYALWYLIYVLGVVKLYCGSPLHAIAALLLSLLHVYFLYWLKMVGYASDGRQASYGNRLNVGVVLLLFFFGVPALGGWLRHYRFTAKGVGKVPSGG